MIVYHRHGSRGIALGLLLALAGCGGGDGINDGDVNVVPLRVEWQLGRSMARDVAAQIRIVADGRAVRLVNEIGDELVGRTEMADRPWTFYVVRGDDLNAFALPGGHVFVYTGLLEAVGSRDELAAVLGHEIAHGIARHGTEQLTKAYGLNILASLVLGKDPAVYEEILARVVGTGAVAKFSRDAEREADRLGIELAAGAGYDPLGMAAFLGTLQEAHRRRPGLVDQIFSTHPLTEERIETAVELGRTWKLSTD